MIICRKPRLQNITIFGTNICRFHKCLFPFFKQLSTEGNAPMFHLNIIYFFTTFDIAHGIYGLKWSRRRTGVKESISIHISQCTNSIYHCYCGCPL